MNNDFIRLFKNNYPNNHTPPFFSILNKILEKNDLNNFKAFLSQNKNRLFSIHCLNITEDNNK